MDRLIWNRFFVGFLGDSKGKLDQIEDDDSYVEYRMRNGNVDLKRIDAATRNKTVRSP